MTSPIIRSTFRQDHPTPNADLDLAVLLEPVILHTGATEGCEHIPSLMWLTNRLQPRRLTLIGASQSVCDTLSFFLHSHALPTRLEICQTLPTKPTDENGLYYLAAPLWPTESILDWLTQQAHPTTGSNVFLFEGIHHTVEQSNIWRALENTPDCSTCTLTQGQGLGILATNPVPANLAPLLSNRPNAQALAQQIRMCQFLAFTGESWLDKSLLSTTKLQAVELESRLSTAYEKNRTLHLRAGWHALQEKALEDKIKALQSNIQKTQEHLQNFAQNMATWRAGLEPARKGLSSLRGMARLAARILARKPPLLAEPPNVPALPPQPASQAQPAINVFKNNEPLHVLFVAGEADTPGVHYRCERNAAACTLAGLSATWKECATVNPGDIAWADILVLWRVAFSGHVSIMLDIARAQNTYVVFDTDDLTFLPHMARNSLIDGIRSIGTTEERMESVFADMQRTLLQAGSGFAPTDALADIMRVYRPVTHTVPNIYDTQTLQRSRLAYRIRQATPDDDIIRIGYATGSRTHQKDFAQISAVMAQFLHNTPNARLVLFKDKEHGKPVLLTKEFPELETVSAQIEWRSMVPLQDLPAELTRFDMAIAPLETQSSFCNAKSELKFFESALAGVPCIVSPTGPFRQCIRHGVTGFLANTPQEWAAALRTLSADKNLRQTIARNAYHAILWPFGPQKQAQHLATLLPGLLGGVSAANAMETLIARSAISPRPLPLVPEHDILFHQDRLEQSSVSVIIPCYNYAEFVLEALESVRTQTLYPLDLIVVDDGSTDHSVTLVRDWMARHSQRFNRLVLLQTRTNSGLGAARNCAVTHVETAFFLPLDADNRLLPQACERLSAVMNDMTAYAYPIIHQFGGSEASPPLGNKPWQPMTLVAGNYIDAMALVAKWAWAAAGGYYVNKDAMGWEDYDLWCTLAELGLSGTHVAETLAEYRLHNTSMTDTVTETSAHKQHLVTYIEHRHPWIRLVQRTVQERAESN